MSIAEQASSLSLIKGNAKLGLVWKFSRMAGKDASCVGATPACLRVCYAASPGAYYDRYKNVVDARRRNEAVITGGFFVEAMVLRMSESSKSGIPEFRIHEDGDFDTATYIQDWIAIAKHFPQTKFWAYTRSWRVAELLPHLEALRALPNVQLFASVDTDTGAPPEGWRVAVMEDEAIKIAHKALLCPGPGQGEKKASCSVCGLCQKGKRGNIYFKLHGKFAKRKVA